MLDASWVCLVCPAPAAGSPFGVKSVLRRRPKPSTTISPAAEETLTVGDEFVPVLLAAVPVRLAVVWCAPVKDRAAAAEKTRSSKVIDTVFAPEAGLLSFHSSIASSSDTT